MPRMCNVIVTIRSLLWTLLTIFSTLALVASVMSPKWLIGQIQIRGLGKDILGASHDKLFRPTIGVINRCTTLEHYNSVYLPHNCATYVTGLNMPHAEFNDWWKVCIVLFGISFVLLTYTVVLAVFSLCVRRCCYRSIFIIAGTTQAVAGVLSFLSLLLYPVGWGSDHLQYMCGHRAGPYYLDQCYFGWSFYLCIVATFCVFLSALLSIPAHTAVTSRKVEEEILEGKALICML